MTIGGGKIQFIFSLKDRYNWMKYKKKKSSLLEITTNISFQRKWDVNYKEIEN